MVCTYFRIPPRLLAVCVLLFLSLPAFAGNWQQNISIGGFAKVHVYTPDTISAIGEGRSLLIILHGCVQPIGSFLTAKMEAAAEAHGMVIAVPDAMNKVGFGCWSYWQGAVSRETGDYKNLIGLASALVEDKTRAIDAKQVYLGGLSSGAAFAAQASCLAPDVFAGVASSAGPTIGTSSAGAVSTCETVSAAQFKARCLAYAGDNADHLTTQMAVIAHGDADRTVNACYNKQNAAGFAAVYGVSSLTERNLISDDAHGRGEEHLWQQGRVAMLWLNSLDHAWSGGIGASGSFISSASISFADYLGQHFAENNPRVDRNQGPAIHGLQVTPLNEGLSISGFAVDIEGYVSAVTVTVSNIDNGGNELAEVINTDVDGAGQFVTSSTRLSNGLYQIAVVGTDEEGTPGEEMSLTRRLGPEPPPQPPVVSELAASVSGRCATVTGIATDANQNLATVTVAVGEIKAPATLSGTSARSAFSAHMCDLPGGGHAVIAMARDATALVHQATVHLEVDAGVTGNYQVHINKGHISWGQGYSSCYFEFGNEAFTMREFEIEGDRCAWRADGAPSCAGPAQACMDKGAGDGVVDACEHVTTYNYYHKLAARAYSSGSYWSPAYYATGSGALMWGATWGLTTLRSSDGLRWHIGACP